LSAFVYHQGYTARYALRGIDQHENADYLSDCSEASSGVPLLGFGVQSACTGDGAFFELSQDFGAHLPEIRNWKWDEAGQ
jgi:hypothetical protein